MSKPGDASALNGVSRDVSLSGRLAGSSVPDGGIGDASLIDTNFEWEFRCLCAGSFECGQK